MSDPPQIFSSSCESRDEEDRIDTEFATDVQDIASTLHIAGIDLLTTIQC